jgi:hypothetical protein
MNLPLLPIVAPHYRNRMTKSPWLGNLGNAAHMLAFSTAADVVTPNRIGTSAAIVNGIMFIVGGIIDSETGRAGRVGN